MPGTRCTVGVCTNSYAKTKKAGLKIKYHVFPKSKSIRDIWIEKCGRGGTWNPDTSNVCSIHFVEDDYEEYNIDKPLDRPMRRKLKKDAVPSLYLMESPPLDISPVIKRRRRNTQKVSLNGKIKVTEPVEIHTKDILQPTNSNIQDKSISFLQLYEVPENLDIIEGTVLFISTHEETQTENNLLTNIFQNCSEQK